MTDSNGRVIQTGDIVTVSGGYFKSSNGLFYVSNLDTERSLWLHRVKKTGELCVDSATSTESWPLHSYCSDPAKNREARRHNEQNARIEISDSVNTWHVAEHFRQKAAERRERAENARRCGGGDPDECEQQAAQYEAVADRLAAMAQPVKAKDPERGIKFYWNGIKVDGGRLIPCYYYPDENSVLISARKYAADLPRQYFNVKNDTDIYTDYFDCDSTTLTPDHPLYRFARYAALKCIATGHDYKKLTEAQAEEWEAMKDPGQPTPADLAAVEEMKLAAENARKAKEQAEEMERREAEIRKRNEGRHFIEREMEKHPVSDGQPTVTIQWSENPAFYAWKDGELVLSIAAAEIILRHFDEQVHAEDRGYDKTKFLIRYDDRETGEESTYEGRYDLGDNDGGLIAHIRSFAEHGMHDGNEKTKILNLADWLEQYTEGGRIVNVEIAPGVTDLLAYRKKKEQEAAKKGMQDILDAVGMLTDDQVEEAVFHVDPEDKANADVARFFLQELARRDESLALDVFRRWKNGAGA